MKYTIIDNPNYTSKKDVGLYLVPENEPLKFFASAIQLSRYPRLLDGIISHVGYGEEFTDFSYYENMDWEDKAEIEKLGGNISEGQVNVYHYVFGETILTAGLFTHLIYDYSKKLLEVYHDGSEATRERLPEGWREDMTEKVALVKRIIDEKYADKEHWLNTSVWVWEKPAR